MERFLNDIAGSWKNVICVGTGNEESSGEHTGSAGSSDRMGDCKRQSPLSVRGAREVPGDDQWPNAQPGYGILCVEERLLGNI